MRLSALSVLVPDYDAGIAFFCGVLGFDLIEDIDQGGDKRWVRVQPNGAQTGFILARAVGADQIAAIGQQGGGRVWLFWRQMILIGIMPTCSPKVSCSRKPQETSPMAGLPFLQIRLATAGI